jgi:hypothetical protein
MTATLERIKLNKNQTELMERIAKGHQLTPRERVWFECWLELWLRLERRWWFSADELGHLVGVMREHTYSFNEMLADTFKRED